MEEAMALADAGFTPCGLPRCGAGIVRRVPGWETIATFLPESHQAYGRLDEHYFMSWEGFT